MKKQTNLLKDKNRVQKQAYICENSVYDRKQSESMRKDETTEFKVLE